jgi:hypothetical protein
VAVSVVHAPTVPPPLSHNTRGVQILEDEGYRWVRAKDGYLSIGHPDRDQLLSPTVWYVLALQKNPVTRTMFETAYRLHSEARKDS